MRPRQGLHPAGCVGIGVDLTVCFRATDKIEGVANLFWLVMKGSHLQIGQGVRCITFCTIFTYHVYLKKKLWFV